MAFGIKYQYSYEQQYQTQPGQTLAWLRISFLFPNYVGTITELLASGTPLIVELDASDNVYEPIQTYNFTFSLACEESWQADEFYVTSNRQIQLHIEIDYTGGGTAYTTAFWGWVDPAELKEAYGSKPYIVSITGTCGLASLKEILLLDVNGNRLSGMVSKSEVIRTALHHTDITSHLITAVNLYEISDVSQGHTINGNARAGLDPLYNEMVHAETFLSEDFDTLSCWDALLKVLGNNLQLKHYGGLWYVVHVPGLGGGWDPWNSSNTTTVHTRAYYGEHLYDPPIDGFDASLDFTVTSGSTSPLRAILDECSYWRQAQQAGIRVEQDFGRRLSGFVNGDMSQVDATGLPVGWSTVNIQDRFRYRVGIGTEDNPFRLVLEGAGDQWLTNDTGIVWEYVEYGTDSAEYTRFMQRTFKCKYRLTNARAAKIILIEERNDGPYLLTDSNGVKDWVLMAKLSHAQSKGILIYNTHDELRYGTNGKPYTVQVTNPGVAEINIDMGTTDRVRKIKAGYCIPEALTLYDANGNSQGPDLVGPPAPKVEYWPAYIEVSENGLVLNGTQQTIVKPGKTVSSSALQLSLGDVPSVAQPVNRVGTTFRRAALPTLEPTTLWFRPDADPSAPGHGVASGNTTLGWVTQERAKQAMLGAWTFEGKLIGPMPWGALSVLVVTDLAQCGRMVVTRLKWDTLLNTHDMTAQQIMAGAADNLLPTPRKEWQSSDGNIPLNAGDDGTPVGPPPTVNKSAFEQLQSIQIAASMGKIPTIQKLLPGFVPLNPQPQPGSIPTLTVLGNGKPLGVVLPRFRKQIDLSKLI